MSWGDLGFTQFPQPEAPGETREYPKMPQAWGKTGISLAPHIYRPGKVLGNPQKSPAWETLRSFLKLLKRTSVLYAGLFVLAFPAVE